MVNHTVHLRPTMPPRDEPLYFSPATWYLFCMIGLFILTAMVHGFEFTALVHGIWYLLCLPSGYLLLIIYSAANLTDRSWGMQLYKRIQLLLNYVEAIRAVPPKNPKISLKKRIILKILKNPKISGIFCCSSKFLLNFFTSWISFQRLCCLMNYFVIVYHNKRVKSSVLSISTVIVLFFR